MTNTRFEVIQGHHFRYQQKARICSSVCVNNSNFILYLTVSMMMSRIIVQFSLSTRVPYLRRLFGGHRGEPINSGFPNLYLLHLPPATYP